MQSKQWLVAHVRPQWEFIVCRQLADWYGIPYFSPFQMVEKKIGVQKRLMRVPVFKNYVFVEVIDHTERIKVLQLDGVIDFVKFQGRPAPVRDEEMQALQQMVGATQDNHCVSIQSIRPLSGQRVDLTADGDVDPIQQSILELPKLGWRVVLSRKVIAAAIL